VEDAVSVEAVAAAGSGAGALLTASAEGLRDLPAVAVSGEVAHAVRHGSRVTAAALGGAGASEGPVRVLDGDGGALLAVYRIADGGARAEVVVA
jgi:hypothetical protein